MMEWSKGDFANFFTEYPESNLMRLRMLYLSEKIKHAGERNLFTTKQKEALFNARQELYKAQAGCAYWHGVFGGVYHGHLRSGVYRHLITAQNLMETVDGGKSVGLYQYDFDGDGSDEYMLSNKFINIYVKPGSSGTVFGLDNRTRALNLMNTMRRKKEPYHSKVVKRSAVNLRSIRDNISSDKYHSIYDIIGLKTRGLKSTLYMMNI
jgi:alpha-amylase